VLVLNPVQRTRREAEPHALVTNQIAKSDDSRRPPGSGRALRELLLGNTRRRANGVFAAHQRHTAPHDRDRLDLADGLGAKTVADLQTERTNFARFDDGAALVTHRLVAAKPYESSINRCRTVSTASR